MSEENQTQALSPEAPFLDFDMSVRVIWAVLSELNIGPDENPTLAEVARLDGQKLLKRKNFGRTSLRDLRALLSRAGLSMADEAPLVPTSAVVSALQSLRANPPSARSIEGYGDGGSDDVHAVWRAAFDRAIAEVTRVG